MQVKDQLSSLQPYKPGKSPEQMKEVYGDHSFVKLASNENPFGCSPRVLDELQNRGWIMLYILTEVLQRSVKQLQISYMCKWNKYFAVVVLDEVIQMISRAVLKAGDNIVTAGATFAVSSSCNYRRLRSEGSCVK